MNKRRPIEINESTNRVEAMVAAIGAMLDKACHEDGMQAIVVIADRQNNDVYSAVLGNEHELGAMLGNAQLHEPRLLTITGLASVCIAEQMKDISNNIEQYEEDFGAEISRIEGIDEEYIYFSSKSNSKSNHS